MTSSLNFSSYIFECCCGERFNNVGAASVCKKCRNYSMWGYTKYVINTETDEVVYGVMPTEEEEAAAEAAATKRWEEEAREFAEMIEAQEERRIAAQVEWDAARAAERAAILEDQLWDLQERLMQ